MSVWVCSMSTVSQGSPTRAMKRAAATLPSVSQVPIWGLPARNARLTGFSFKGIPHHQMRFGLLALEASGTTLPRPEFRTSRPEGQDTGHPRSRADGGRSTRRAGEIGIAQPGGFD